MFAARSNVSRPRVYVALTALAASALLLSSCGGDGDGTTGSDVLIGTWESSDGGTTWVLDGESINVTFNAQELVSEYTATDTTIEINDVSGPFACPPTQTGIYEWEVEADVLSLTVVEDPCGRVNSLDGVMFERTE